MSCCKFHTQKCFALYVKWNVRLAGRIDWTLHLYYRYNAFHVHHNVSVCVELTIHVSWQILPKFYTRKVYRMFMCLVTFLWSENLLLHIAHLNGFRDTCVCSCIFTEELIQNVTALDIYVLQYLSKMTKLNKSGGPDGISNHILKMCADYVQWRAARLVSNNF